MPLDNTAHQKRKRGGDFYTTPEWATEALMTRERFDGIVWECASGDGRMAKVIEKHNQCYASDIQQESYIYGARGVDFLRYSGREYDNIITNPPYSNAERFVRNAKMWATKKVAMLLKLTFLEGQARKTMFMDKVFPISKVYVFSKRVELYPYGIEKPKNSGVIAYAWYVWDKTHSGSPVLEWI